MALMVVNALYIAAGIAQLEILPAFAKNEAGVRERGIGWLFFINTIVVVLLQLPTTRLAEGRRRMPLLALVGVVSAAAWLLVPRAGSGSRARPRSRCSPSRSRCSRSPSACTARSSRRSSSTSPTRG